MTATLQHTIGQAVSLQGVGVHSGAEARVRLSPAAPGSGIVFVRLDAPDGLNHIPAHIDNLHHSVNATTLRNAFGVTIATTEHLLAACAGLGIDNLLVEIDGPELPILDGSAAPFARVLQWARVVAQPAARRLIRVLKRVEVRAGAKIAALSPLERDARAPSFDVSVAFAHPAIGTQRRAFALSTEAFLTEIADSRTFGFLREWDQMRAAGLGRGADYANTVVFDDQGVVNPEGLRHEDEIVRHKILDAVGDLLLAGAPVLGRYEAAQPGHALNAALVRALLADAGAYRIEGGESVANTPLAVAG